jgi:hypothetical protein
MKVTGCLLLFLLLSGSIFVCPAVESGMCRLLSVSESEKLILVSTIPDKKRYLLDVAAAKITIAGEPAEFERLISFSLIQVKWDETDERRNGVRLDGIAIDIEIDPPRQPQPKQ